MLCWEGTLRAICSPAYVTRSPLPVATALRVSTPHAWVLSPWRLMCFTAPELHPPAVLSSWLPHEGMCSGGFRALFPTLDQRLLEASRLLVSVY